MLGQLLKGVGCITLKTLLLLSPVLSFSFSVNNVPSSLDNVDLPSSLENAHSSLDDIPSVLVPSLGSLEQIAKLQLEYLKDYAPSEWSQMCAFTLHISSDVTITLSCNVTVNTFWALQDLRNLLDNVPQQSDLKLAVRLECGPGGAVSLPWPMRAARLVALEVRGCLLLDKLRDFNTSALAIPDSMARLKLENCTWLNRPDDVRNVLDNAKSVTAQFECGQDQTLVEYRYRQISDQDIQAETVCNQLISRALRLFKHNLKFPGEAWKFGDWSKKKLESFLSNTRVLGGAFDFCVDALHTFLMANTRVRRSTTKNLGDLSQNNEKRQSGNLQAAMNDFFNNLQKGNMSVIDRLGPDFKIITGAGSNIVFSGISGGDDSPHKPGVGSNLVFSGISVPENSLENKSVSRSRNENKPGANETDFDSKSKTNITTIAGTDSLEDRIDMKHIRTGCIYEKMEIYDESTTTPVDRKHFEYLVDKTEYPQLRILNFSSTQITEVPRELLEWRVYFDKSPLELIDLSHNNITRVGPIPVYPNRFINLTTKLDLQSNKISTVTFSMFQEWSKQPDFWVDVRNNPIDCSCDKEELQDLVSKLKDASQWVSPAMVRYREAVSGLRCSSPPALHGLSLAALTADHVHCPQPAPVDQLPLIAAMAAVLAVLIVLLILAVGYREEVRILLYTRAHILLPCGPRRTDPDAPEKKYDVFVAHSSKDENWVLGTLRERLEAAPTGAKGPPALRTCIHQRDFVVGMPIIDNIIEGIAASRHTLVVLTRNFAQSQWAMEELRQALRQSMEERRRHLVVVRLEKLEDQDMPPVLRRCVKTFTYLDATDALFWDRLQYSLRVSYERKGRRSSSEEDIFVTTTSNGGVLDSSSLDKTTPFSEEMISLDSSYQTKETETMHSSDTKGVDISTHSILGLDQIKIEE